MPSIPDTASGIAASRRLLGTALALSAVLVVSGCGQGPRPKKRRASPAKPSVKEVKTEAVPPPVSADAESLEVEPVISHAEAIELRTNEPGALPTDLDELAAEPYASGTLAAAGGSKGGRLKVRQLFSFEDSETYEIDGKPIAYLNRFVDDLSFVYVRDNCVTDGKWCARASIRAGAPWGALTIRGDAVKDWSEYDYFAMDLFIDDDHPYTIVFELWDGSSRDYQTRCTFEGTTTRKGMQTLMWPINRAKRNNKEGRGWEELEPQDKIDMNALSSIKIFTTPREDRPMMFWMDNLRLMQEDAAKPKMSVSLPNCVAAAFDFGSAGAAVQGFKAVDHTASYDAALGHGFDLTDGLSQGGKGWPDLLTGTFVRAGHNQQIRFEAKVPNGQYRYWLCAGAITDTSHSDPEFLLRLNDETIHRDKPSYDEYDGRKYIHRHLWTQYSERPHAPWLDYVDKMYTVHQGTVDVADGRVTLTACNYFLSALILVPVKHDDDFKRMSAKILRERLNAFDKVTHIVAHDKPAPAAEDGDYVLFIPDTSHGIGPDSGPSDAERARRKIVAAATPGENVFMQIAVTPFKDLGACELGLSDLSGPAGRISASAIKPHFINYRFHPRNAGEMTLLPSAALRIEKGVTACFWLWLSVPEDAASGEYEAEFVFRSANSTSTKVKVKLEVYPFLLEKTLPVSYGMYYGGRGSPSAPQHEYWGIVRKQMDWMREIGFTSVFFLTGPGVRDIDLNGGSVSLGFNPMGIDIAREAGFFKHPSHLLVTAQLGIARGIARRLPAIIGAKVDQQPGIEFTRPEFKKFYMNAMRQYKKFLDDQNVPYAMEIVDEPRETPNPWNRNLEDTCRYGDWMAEAGIGNRFVTPMGDGGAGKDYTKLCDHSDIISIHGWSASAKLMNKTKELGKTLWFYNTGMDRLVWGFYPWKHGATGRFEWHWSWCEGSSTGGYPGNEWHNPFTVTDGMASNAPPSEHPGGFVYKTALLSTADGITDYAYLHTLEKALERNRSDAAKSAAVRKADALLSKIRAAVPEWPKGDKRDAAVAKMDVWRSEIAALIEDLM